jgi:hypothetical protein
LLASILGACCGVSGKEIEMTEPIKLPPISGRLTFLSAADQYAITGLMQLAVEQATADLRAELETERAASKVICDELASVRRDMNLICASNERLRNQLEKAEAERDEAIKDRDDVLASYADACQQLLDAEKAGDEARAELEGHKAARMAYASEFPPNEEGEPDVGSIHQNIRALKAELARLTTLRPIASLPPNTQCLRWTQSRTGQHWMLVDKREWHSHWTPLPPVKEADK